MQVVEKYGWTKIYQLSDVEYFLTPITKYLLQGSGLNILDAGCGSGFITAQLAGLGHQVIGIDASPDGIELATKVHPQIRWEVASVYDDLSHVMPRGGWDVILSSEVIEHLYAPQRFLDNMHRHLRPGGFIILTTPYHGYLKNLALSLFNAWDKHFTVDWEGGHIKFFSPKTLSAMLKNAGFAKIQFRGAGRVPYLWKSMVCRAERLD